MQTQLVVPDASVLLKWVLPSDDEPDADKAQLLRAAIMDEAVDALLPASWIYEVGNTLRDAVGPNATGTRRFQRKPAAPKISGH